MSYNKSYNQDTTVAWQASQPFYEHLKILWDAEFNARRAINETEDYRIIAKYLEDWFEAIDTMATRIRPFVTADQTEKLDKFSVNVEELTQGQSFISAGLSGQGLYDLKQTIRKYSIYCFQLMGEQNMLLPRQAKAVFDEDFM
jgi:replicative DNA helicase